MAGVIKLAQSGFDVKTAGDENLIYSSDWPLLKIYQQDSVTIPDVTQSYTIAEHDLNFPPAYWFFSNATPSAWQNTGTLVTDTRSEFFGPTGGGTISINEKKLLFTPSAGTATGSLKLYYYIFALDLTKLFTAPIIKVGQVGGRRDGFTFRVAKEGKDVHSDNLQDFIIHSDARSPLIHSVTPGVVNEATSLASEYRFAVQHNLGYNPMFFGYAKSGNAYTLLATGSGGSSIFDSDERQVSFREGASGREMTIIILKDPFIADYSVGVSV